MWNAIYFLSKANNLDVSEVVGVMVCSSVIILVQKLSERVLTRTHRMIGLIVALVIGIIAFTETVVMRDWPFIRTLRLLNLLKPAKKMLQNFGIRKIE